MKNDQEREELRIELTARIESIITDHPDYGQYEENLNAVVTSILDLIRRQREEEGYQIIERIKIGEPIRDEFDVPCVIWGIDQLDSLLADRYGKEKP